MNELALYDEAEQNLMGLKYVQIVKLLSSTAIPYTCLVNIRAAIEKYKQD